MITLSKISIYVTEIHLVKSHSAPTQALERASSGLINFTDKNTGVFSSPAPWRMLMSAEATGLGLAANGLECCDLFRS